MQQINWGFIGCGNVTELKSGPAFEKVAGSKVMAVMRRDTEKARDYAIRHSIPNWYDNADDLINNPQINAVYIATPPSSHPEYAIRAMEKGKAVYVEKPMAACYDDCMRMHEASLRTGMPLFIAYYRRFLPYFIKVREILESGQLGTLLYATIDFHVAPRAEDFNANALPWRVNPEIAGAGYFYDLACHQLDLFDWFFGKVTEVSGRKYNRRGLYKAEDLVLAQLTYESGIPVAGQWCFAAAKNEQTDVIRIFGSEASMEFSTFDFAPVKVINADGIMEHLPLNPENIQYWFIRNMVQELQGSGPVYGNNESAVRTNWVMDKILGKI